MYTCHSALRGATAHSVPCCTPCRPRPTPLVRAQALATPTTGKQQPDWTGDNVLSKIVNWAINTPPLYSAMKRMAKQEIKVSAEKRGVNWDQHVEQLASTAAIQNLKVELEKQDIVYPSYYLQPFHAYDEGNLNWLAAYEVEPATYAMAIRTYKSEPTLSPEAAFSKLRGSITSAMKEHMQKHGLAAPQSIVDMGCSTGMSTRWLAQQFPSAHVLGLDLSPYFLAVAEWEERRDPIHSSDGSRRIQYIHGIAESCGLPDASQDIVAFNFVIHECPQQPIRAFIKESRRLLKPNGMLVFVDNNPASESIQNLPLAISTLMKSTEPWSDQYYSLDLEAAMRDAGFKEVVTVATDHRHRTVMGIAP